MKLWKRALRGALICGGTALAVELWIVRSGPTMADVEALRARIAGVPVPPGSVAVRVADDAGSYWVVVPRRPIG